MRKDQHNKWDELDAISKQEADQLWEMTKSYKSSYKPDMASAFSKFEKATQNEGIEKGRVKQLPRFSFLRIAASLLFVLGTIGLWQYFANANGTLELATIDQQEEVLLSDGTFVTLNKNSTLTYPNSFSGARRVVTLEGEAFFKVAKNAKKPFVIQTNKTDIQVLGTEFNVRAYAKETITEVAVQEGKVAFGIKGKTENLILTANERGTFNSKNNKLVEENSGVTEWAWVENRLSFRKANFTEIKMILERYFSVQIELKGTFDTCQSITANLNDNDSLDTVLAAIANNVDISYQKDTSGNYIITGNCY